MKTYAAILVLALCAVAHSEEEKNQDKRAIIYSSYGYPYTRYISYVPTVFKRDTAAVEADTEDEKNLDKRAVVIGSPLVYPYSSYYTWPYTLVKRETEESSEHAIQKREVNQEEEKNVDKRAVIIGSPMVYPYSSYYTWPYTLVKRETEESSAHAIQKREVNQEEEKNVDKRAVIIGSPLAYPYSSYYTWPYTLVKRETEESSEHAIQKREVNQEEEKNVDKRAVIIGSPLVFPYSSYYTWPYGIVKRETEEGSEHTVQKREATEEESKMQEKRDLLLGYGYPYYRYYGYPSFRYWL